MRRARRPDSREEQLQERLDDRYRALDVPLLVEWADGSRDPVVFAMEEESDWRRFSPRGLARYCLDLAEMLGTDRVVPVTIFLRAAERAAASLALGTERHRHLVFDYVACRLAEMPAAHWLDSCNLVARLNLPNMDSGTLDRVDVYASAVRGLFELEADGDRQAKYLEVPGFRFIDIYARLTDNEKRRYRRQYPEEADIVTGFLQRARDEGIEQGREQGMRQGRAEGERVVLARLLRRRFGRLPAEAAERLRRAPEADLEAWADNVLDARTLDEVFRTAR